MNNITNIFDRRAARRVLCLLLLSGALYAQSGTSITGTVKDPQGQAVAGTVINLFSRTGDQVTSTTSDVSGGYRFDGLAAGDYLVRATASGFAPFLAENIHLNAGAAEKRDILLQLVGVREQVVVTASGTPQLPEQVSKATTVIDQAEIDARDSATISGAVNLAPGVRVQQLGGPGAFTSIQIRGLRDQDTAVLVDGLRLRDASATQADASGLIEDLLFTDAGRIEVMSGSGSSLYGTNAIGGVVNVITDQGGGRTRGNILLEGGSLGAFRGRAQISGAFRNDRIQYSAGFADTNVSNGVDGNSPYRDVSTQGRVTFHLSPSLRITARLFGADSFSKVRGEPDLIGGPSGYGIVNASALSPTLAALYEQGTPLAEINTGSATFIPAPNDPDSTRAARFVSAALILNGQASPALDYSVSYQLVSNSRRYGNGPVGVDFQPEGNTRSLYDGHIQTADAQAHYRLGFNLFSAGYEFENENYAFDSTDQSDPAAASATNVTQRSHSVFAQDQLQFLGGRLQISGAFRAQFFALETPLFQPLAAAPYQGIGFPSPTPAYTGDGSVAYFFRKSNTKLRAHVGRGYRAPSLYERFGSGFDPVFGYTVYGDPRLTPEHSIGVDGGIDQTFLRERLKLSASYFYTALQNVITFDTSGVINPATDPFGRFLGYFNTKGGLSRGVETSASAAPTRSLKLTATYTYINAIQRAPVVGDVLQTFVVPRNQFSFLVTEQATSRLLLTLDTVQSTSYLAPIYGATVTQTYRFDGLHKVNAGVSYRLPLAEYRAVRFFVRADNLANQTYFESGFPTPGRTASAGLQYEF
ncbi:MAG TPA: TonB-dependent receptor [Bryobacteraceae bacterium]|nr:TonB-dependent receptor [Bryobacteraceae bacterium]